MKKIIVALLVALMLTGCATKTKSPQDTEAVEVSRFVVVEDSQWWWIVADREAGYVMYAVSRGGYNTGNFTLLVDKDGKPLTWKGE